jgi:hypothetical protein
MGKFEKRGIPLPLSMFQLRDGLVNPLTGAVNS